MVRFYRTFLSEARPLNCHGVVTIRRLAVVLDCWWRSYANERCHTAATACTIGCQRAQSCAAGFLKRESASRNSPPKKRCAHAARRECARRSRASLALQQRHTRSPSDHQHRCDRVCKSVRRMMSARARSIDKETRDSCRPSRYARAERASAANFWLILAAPFLSAFIPTRRDRPTRRSARPARPARRNTQLDQFDRHSSAVD